MDIRRLNSVWVVLMLATLATWEVGEQGIAGPLAMALLLILSFVKGAWWCSTSWACAASNSSGAAC
jgi:hypothetical protein